MLVLTRKESESVVIQIEGKEVCRVQVVEIDRNKVMVGFDAPQNVKIYRSELLIQPQALPTA